MYRRRRAVQSQQREVAPKAVDGGRDSRRALGAVDIETLGRALDVVDERAGVEFAGRDAHDVPLGARRVVVKLPCGAQRVDGLFHLCRDLFHGRGLRAGQFHAGGPHAGQIQHARPRPPALRRDIGGLRPRRRRHIERDVDGGRARVESHPRARGRQLELPLPRDRVFADTSGMELGGGEFEHEGRLPARGGNRDVTGSNVPQNIGAG